MPRKYKIDDDDAVVFRGDGEARTGNTLLKRLNDFAQNNLLEDDDFSVGGLVQQLENEMASKLGKPKAIFMPSGTLANHLAIRRHAGTDGRAAVQEQSHIFNDTGDSIQRLSGINLVPLGYNKVYFDTDELHKAYETSITGRVLNPISVVSIETPVRRKHGQVVPLEELSKLSKFCKTNGIRVHLDGARIFMQAIVNNKDVKEYARLFESVYVSLYKYLGAPFGSILAGETDFIDGMHHQRRMFGSGLANSSLVAALALHGLDNFENKFSKAIDKANELFSSLNKSERVSVKGFEHGSNIFELKMAENINIDQFVLNLRNFGIFVFPEDNQSDIYIHVNATILHRSNAEITKAFLDAIDESFND